MIQITIKELNAQSKALLALAKTLSSVEVTEVDEKTVKITKEEFLADFTAAVIEVKNNKTRPLKELFDGK